MSNERRIEATATHSAQDDFRDFRSGSRSAVFGLRLLSGVIGAIGAALTVGGAQLASLGGSQYYIIAGLLLVTAAILLFLRRRRGVTLYSAVFAITVAWSVYEVGFDGWKLLPRVFAWALLGSLLLLPWIKTALKDAPKRAMSITSTGFWPSAFAVAAGIGFALHAMLIVPGLPADPRFQIGYGNFPTGSLNGASPSGAAQDWLFFGGDQGGSRFSSLDQINPGNVTRLKVAWSVDVGDKPGMTATPIEIGGRIFTCHEDQIFAVDARTGRTIWRFDGSKGYPGRCRGVSHFSSPESSDGCASRILAGIGSNTLIALDALTGVPCSDFGHNGVVNLLRGMGDISGKVIPG